MVSVNYFNGIFHNVRFYVLVCSVMAACIIGYSFQTPQFGLTIVRAYALVALGYLYVTLLAGPLTRVFPNFPLRAKYLKARRALGVSTFLFAVLHGYFAFFDEVGGIQGLIASPFYYIFAILCASIVLVVLFLMAATSFDDMVKKLTFKKWKTLHRFVYLAGILILIHSALIGTQFADKFSAFPLVVYGFVFVLLLLEAIAYKKMIDLRKGR